MGIVIATTNSLVGGGPGRQPIVIRKGEAWASDDPVVTSHPDLFGGEKAARRSAPAAPVVESVTRGPGERRKRTSRTDAPE